MEDAPIFIVGAHKSGTSLMRSLLDGHPKLYAFPFELHFFECQGYAVSNEYRRQTAWSGSHEQQVARFEQAIRTIAQTRDAMGGTATQARPDPDRFMEHFSTISSEADEETWLTHYFESVSQALPAQRSSGQRWVEKSVEQAEFAARLQQLFPQARFIHMVRNPYANVVALREYRRKRHRFPLWHRVMRTLEQQYFWAQHNRQVLDHYHVIRYEDLVQQPESTMRSLSKKLDLSYESSLLQPTVLGQPWSGNSSDQSDLSGISTERLDAWRSDIHPAERYYINRMLTRAFADFGYMAEPATGNFWKPAPSESIPRYAANRLFRFYLTEYPSVNACLEEGS
jgi:hypothetical protein